MIFIAYVSQRIDLDASSVLGIGVAHFFQPTGSPYLLTKVAGIEEENNERD
jgi:hypothetical protein